MKARHIIPALVYDDAPAAIDFLCKVFGFEKHLVVPGENGIIHHAQLKNGAVMVMLGSANSGSEYADHCKAPGAFGGMVSQSPYIVVDDPDAVYEKAREHGARIVIAIKDEDYGGRGFTCADPEGHLWNFGSYDPWTDR